MRRFYIILTFISCSIYNSIAQKVILKDSLWTVNNYENRWSYVKETLNSSFSYPSIISEIGWEPIKQFPQVFPSKNKAIWLKATLKNRNAYPMDIRIITKGIDSLNTYWINQNNEKGSFVTGKFIPLLDRFVASQFLVIPIKLQPNSITDIYVRIYNQSYPLGLPYLKISTPKATNSFIKIGEIGYNVYFGGLILMILFSIILFAFFKERLYFFYLCCLILSFAMVAIYNDFYYLFIDKSPEFFRNKNVFAVLTTLLNSIYLLFAERYLNVDKRKNSKAIKISRFVILAVFILLISLLAFQEELYHYRRFFYPLFGANTLMMYYHLIKSIQKKYSPSWYFLIASSPIALVSLLEITSDYNGVPVQTMHDLYYAGTFIEMFFLTIGIVYRFRIERTNVQILQQELYIAEIKTQEIERERIAQDLHDTVNASIAGIQKQLSEFGEQYFKEKTLPPVFQDSLNSLSQIYDDVRGVTQELMPQVLANLGLVEQIKQKYGATKNPIFRLSLPTEPLQLTSFEEITLHKIINEAVQNIYKHANATEVGIVLMQDNNGLKLRIEDNGIGFNTAKSLGEGIGLKSLKLRAEAQLKGTISIESNPGNGTIIILRITKPISIDKRIFKFISEILKRLKANYE
jgi:signal transduction histidine kinase